LADNKISEKHTAFVFRNELDKIGNMTSYIEMACKTLSVVNTDEKRVLDKC